MAGKSDRGQPDRPDYKVYRSRPGLLGRLRAPDLGSLRERGGGGKGKSPRRPREDGPDRPRPPWRRILKWAGIAALGWILLSMIAFAVSAQIQKGKGRPANVSQ